MMMITITITIITIITIIIIIITATTIIIIIKIISRAHPVRSRVDVPRLKKGLEEFKVPVHILNEQGCQHDRCVTRVVLPVGITQPRLQEGLYDRPVAVGNGIVESGIALRKVGHLNSNFLN